MVGTTTVYQTQIRILAVSDFTRPITPDSRDFAFETIIDPTSMISSFFRLKRHISNNCFAYLLKLRLPYDVFD